MKHHVRLIAVAMTAFAFVVTGCSTTDSRIKDRQAAFNASSPEVQAKIRAGKVEIGFTSEQVLMALGKPDREYSRTTAKGASNIWAYADNRPKFSFGVGMVSGGGGSVVGSGVSVATGGDRYDDRLRVIIEGGRVVAIETSGRH